MITPLSLTVKVAIATVADFDVDGIAKAETTGFITSVTVMLICAEHGSDILPAASFTQTWGSKPEPAKISGWAQATETPPSI